MPMMKGEGESMISLRDEGRAVMMVWGQWKGKRRLHKEEMHALKVLLGFMVSAEMKCCDENIELYVEYIHCYVGFLLSPY